MATSDEQRLIEEIGHRIDLYSTALLRLKTDVEEHISPNDPAQIGLEEEFFRGAVETAMQNMEACDLKAAMEQLLIVDTAHRFLTRYDDHRRIAKIENLLIDTLVEIANNNCKCQFKEG